MFYVSQRGPLLSASLAQKLDPLQNPDLFTRKKGGYALIWLSATLPAQSRIRRITKKELLTCNVVRECRKIIEPEEPLALRLTSTLMVFSKGLDVEKKSQLNSLLLYSLGSPAYIRDKKAVLETNSSTQDPNRIHSLDESSGSDYQDDNATIKTARSKGRQKTSAKNDINLASIKDQLAADLALNLDLGGTFHNDAWIRLQEELGKGEDRAVRARGTPGIEDDYDELASDGLEKLADAAFHLKPVKGKRKMKGIDTGSRKKSSLAARAEDINLPEFENDLLHYESVYYDDIGEQFVCLESVNSTMGDETELLLGGTFQLPEEGLDLDFDLGLEGFDELPPPLVPDTSSQLQIGMSSFAGGEGGIHLVSQGRKNPTRQSSVFSILRHQDEFTPDKQSHPNVDYNADDYAMDLDAPFQGPVDAVEPPGKNHPSSQPQSHDNGQDQRSESRTSSMPTSPGIDKGTTGKPRGRKASKKHVQIIDKSTSMTIEQIAKNRDSYTVVMKKLNDARELKMKSDKEKERFRYLFTGVPEGINDPSIVEFFNQVAVVLDVTKRKLPESTSPAKDAALTRDPETFLARKRRLANDSRSREPNAAASIVGGDKRKEREATALSSQLGRGDMPATGQNGAFDMDFGGNDYPFDYEGGENVPPSRDEFKLPANHHGHGRQESYDFENESNVGRGRERSFSGPVYPWDVDDEPSALIFFSGGATSSFIGGLPSRRTSATFEYSRPGSLSPTLSPLASPRPGSPIPRRGNSFGSETAFHKAIRRRSRSSSFGPADFSDDMPGEIGRGRGPEWQTQAAQAVDQGETQKTAALDRATGKFVEFARNNCGPDGDLHFSDLVPVATTEPTVAAMAFYHLLVAASKNLIKVQSQQEAYGEIELLIPVF